MVVRTRGPAAGSAYLGRAMAGIGETLREERRRQGRTLADVAAETRVRESYLAAIEEEDFGVLGGDVYARGFIRLYGNYLSLDADSLVEAYRATHDQPQPQAALPTVTFDDGLDPEPPGLPPWLSPPVLAAVGIVGLLVVLFVFFRAASGGGGDPEDTNAPGPSPAEVSEDEPATLPSSEGTALADRPANPLVDGPVDTATAGEPLTELVIDVSVLAPVRMHVVRGQPPVNNATLEQGDFRQLTGDPAVIFQVSDATAVDIQVNGLPLVGLGGPGQAVQVSCVIGRPGCDVEIL